MKSRINNFLYDLFLSFLVTLIIGFFTSGFNIDFTSFIAGLEQYSFLIYWLLLLAVVLLLRLFIRKMIDKKQHPPDIFFIAREYQGTIKFDHFDLSWEVVCDYKLKSAFFSSSTEIDLEEIKDIDIGLVKGPFCPNDKRIMNTSRNYWGFFKYQCPKCKYKKLIILNRTTLEKEISDEIESMFR